MDSPYNNSVKDVSKPNLICRKFKENLKSPNIDIILKEDLLSIKTVSCNSDTDMFRLIVYLTRETYYRNSLKNTY